MEKDGCEGGKVISARRVELLSFRNYVAVWAFDLPLWVFVHVGFSPTFAPDTSLEPAYSELFHFSQSYLGVSCAKYGTTLATVIVREYVFTFFFQNPKT